MKQIRIILLPIVFFFCCGFTWGFGTKDPCLDAKVYINSVLIKQNGKLNQAQENEILAKCPDGAAGRFVQGLQSEREEKIDDALRSYRDAIRIDPTFNEIHGKLGLLLNERKDTNNASVELTKGLTERSNPEWHKALGMILLDGGMYALARYHLGESLSAYGNDSGVMEGIAACQEHLGDLIAAEKSYKTVLSGNPGNMKAQLGLARTYLLSGKPDEAQRMIEPVAQKNDSKEAHELLARIYREKGLVTQAEREYKLAGTTIAIPLDEYVRKGDGFLLRREYDKAIKAYNTALSRHPNWAEVLEKIGDTYNAAGQDEEAFDYYRRATTQKDAGPTAWYSLAVLYERKGNLDAALASYRNSLTIDYENGDTRRRLADIYILKGDFQRASEEYGALIKLRPDNPLLHFKLARIYEKGKKNQDAVREYLETIRINRDNIEAHRELAFLYVRMKMSLEAEKHYREVLRLNKADNDARNALVAICVRKKDYDCLYTLLKEATELNPADPESFYRLGQIFEFRNDYEPAIQNYLKTIELKEDHAKAWNGLGRVYLKTGDKTKARDAINTSKSIDSQLTETINLLSQIQNTRDDTKKKKSRKVKKK